MPIYPRQYPLRVPTTWFGAPSIIDSAGRARSEVQYGTAVLVSSVVSMKHPASKRGSVCMIMNYCKRASACLISGKVTFWGRGRLAACWLGPFAVARQPSSPSSCFAGGKSGFGPAHLLAVLIPHHQDQGPTSNTPNQIAGF